MNTWNPPRRRRNLGVRWLLLMVLALLPILAACSSGRGDSTPAPTPADPAPTSAPASGPPPAPTPAGASSSARQGLDLTILHTNDVRGEIEPCG